MLVALCPIVVAVSALFAYDIVLMLVLVAASMVRFIATCCGIPILLPREKGGIVLGAPSGRPSAAPEPAASCGVVLVAAS